MPTTFINTHPKTEIINHFQQHVSSGKVNFFQSIGIDFIPGKREGVYLWDISGEKQLINCHCNGGVFNLGHRNPTIINTLIKSLQELDIGNHHLLSEQRATLAAKLAQLLPGDMSYTVFNVGGGEAIDLAIKIARGYTHKSKIISAKGGYHGHTGLALGAGDEKYYTPFGLTAPNFVQIPFNTLTALANTIDDQTAAVLLETIPATSGIPIPDNSYFAEVKKLCHQHNALLIIDEVQTGLGRTGKLWGIEHFDVVPDILVIGKGLSGGIYPITATCFRPELETIFHQDPFIHISTFGGAEVGCPVALKVLELSSDPTFLDHVTALSNTFATAFEGLKPKYPELLVKLRRLGLMMGIELVNEYCGPIFSKIAYEYDLLAIYAYNNPSVVQLLPPLIIDQAIATEIIIRIDKTLTKMQTMF